MMSSGSNTKLFCFLVILLSIEESESTVRISSKLYEDVSFVDFMGIFDGVGGAILA